MPEQKRSSTSPGPDSTGRYSIWFARSLTRRDRARLQQRYGLRLDDYLPDFAYVEVLSAETLDRLAADPLFTGAAPYGLVLIEQPDIGERVYRTMERRGVVGLWLLAVLFSDVDPAGLTRALAALGARDIQVLDARELSGTARIRFIIDTREQFEQVAELDGIRWLDEWGESVDDNVNAAGTLQSGSPGNHRVWAAGLHGEGQIIAVMDAGPLDLGHCFFRDDADNTPGPPHRKVIAVRNASGTPVNSHATFVAGCAAGDSVTEPGAHVRRGGAWAARLVSANRRDLTRAPLLAELTAAAALGATIHTNSWHENSAGVGQPAIYNQSAADVDTFMWRNEDHLVLGSAGNSGEELGPPGTAKNAICVGATRADPEEMSFGDGNEGPTADGRLKPDLMAPGCGIRSANFHTPCRTGALSGCASSYATPHAAAGAALVRQYFVEGRHPSGRPRQADAFVPSGALLKAMLLNSTVNMTGVPGYPGNREGWGIIRLDNVLGLPAGGRALRLWDVRHARGLFTGQSRTHRFRVAAGARALKVTLVWTDPPGPPGSAPAAVNNLDLVVRSPAGVTYLGNWFVDEVSAPDGWPDAVNNVETVLVPAPAEGDWSARVAGTAVNLPAQGYALVVSWARPEPAA